MNFNMKKKLLSIITILFAFIFYFNSGNNDISAHAAGLFSSENPLLGKWVNYQEEISITIDKGGTGIFDGMIVDWETKNGNIRFKADEHMYVVDEQYTYNVNGDILTLTSEDARPIRFLRDDDYTGPNYNPVVGNWVGEVGSIVFSHGTGVARGETFNWFSNDFMMHIDCKSLDINDNYRYFVSGNSLILEDNGSFFRDGRVDARTSADTINRDQFIDTMNNIGLSQRNDFTLQDISNEYSISPGDIYDVCFCTDDNENLAMFMSLRNEDLAKALYKYIAGDLASESSFDDALVTASSGTGFNKLTIDDQQYSEFVVVSRVGNTILVIYGENYYYSSLTLNSVDSILRRIGY